MGLAFHVSFALILVFLATGCVRTLPFTDVNAASFQAASRQWNPQPSAAFPQSLWFRGVSRSDPALILLHGGPGTSESALFRHYNSALEHHFLVVYWEQRGTGCSFNPAISPQTMTIAQFGRDLDEVVKLVRRRFDKDKAVLLAHSWARSWRRSMPPAARRRFRPTSVSRRLRTSRRAASYPMISRFPKQRSAIMLRSSRN